MLKKYLPSVLFFFFSLPVIYAALPVADLIVTGNLRGFPEKTDLTKICQSAPYGIWILPGNTLGVPEKNKKEEAPFLRKAGDPSSFQQSYARKFSAAGTMPVLMILGEKDFHGGLHEAVRSLRSLRYNHSYVLDYIGARNNENPWLLKYVDILVNGKTVRFVGLGAWEKLYPKKESIAYRMPNSLVMKEIRDYLSQRKNADFTILITSQKGEYDRNLARNKDVSAVFDLIISGEAVPSGLEKVKGGIPILRSGKCAEELWKVFLNPVPGGVGGEKITVWKDEKYKRSF